jgi:hypothetical protein
MTYVKVAAICMAILMSGCGAKQHSAVQWLNPTSSADAAEQPQLTVYKNASCGCCKVWVEHMRKHGFAAKVNDVDNMNPIKERVGVPYGMGSCHTAEVGGYFIEGHVPAEQVARLLKEKPKAKGLTVPGMPIGSPGMEQGDTVQPYEVHLVLPDGTTSVYAKYPQ